MARGPPCLVRFWGDWELIWALWRDGVFVVRNLAAKVARVRRMGVCIMMGARGTMEIRCGNPDQKAASTSLARYRDRRSLSQVCNEAISEIGAEPYSSEDANYSER